MLTELLDISIKPLYKYLKIRGRKRIELDSKLKFLISDLLEGFIDFTNALKERASNLIPYESLFIQYIAHIDYKLKNSIVISSRILKKKLIDNNNQNCKKKNGKIWKNFQKKKLKLFVIWKNPKNSFTTVLTGFPNYKKINLLYKNQSPNLDKNRSKNIFLASIIFLSLLEKKNSKMAEKFLEESETFLSKKVEFFNFILFSGEFLLRAKNNFQNYLQLVGFLSFLSKKKFFQSNSSLFIRFPLALSVFGKIFFCYIFNPIKDFLVQKFLYVPDKFWRGTLQYKMTGPLIRWFYSSPLGWKNEHRKLIFLKLIAYFQDNIHLELSFKPIKYHLIKFCLKKTRKNNCCRVKKFLLNESNYQVIRHPKDKK